MREMQSIPYFLLLSIYRSVNTDCKGPREQGASLPRIKMKLSQATTRASPTSHFCHSSLGHTAHVTQQPLHKTPALIYQKLFPKATKALGLSETVFQAPQPITGWFPSPSPQHTFYTMSKFSRVGKCLPVSISQSVAGGFPMRWIGSLGDRKRMRTF